MKRQWVFRGLFYGIGVLVLNLGLALCSRCGLGTLPVSGISFVLAEILNVTFGTAVMGTYTVFVLAQIAIQRKRPGLRELLQLPLSVASRWLLDLFCGWFPRPETLGPQVGMMLLGVFFTGIGVAMNVDMKLIPSPGDGIVEVLSNVSGRELGLAKNFFDAFCVISTLLIGLCTGHFLSGLGAATLVGAVGVGRVVSLFNRLFRDKMWRLAGLSD